MVSLREKYRAFRAWQQRPYTVAPLSDEEHGCFTCGTRYRGNFCPRCGQSAQVGRFSFKVAVMQFVDSWFVGDRSFFRCIRDLIFRPGYMIRDYLRGMQMAYFPPFKLLFMLTTLSILVTYGMNIQGRSVVADVAVEAQPQSVEDEKVVDRAYDFFRWMMDMQQRYPNAIPLLAIGFLSLLVYAFFRKSRTIQNLRFSEALIAVVYCTSMTTIYSTLFTFFCLDSVYLLFAELMIVVPLKQLFGFSWWQTVWRVIASYLILLFLIFILVVAIVASIIYFPEYF